MKTLLRLLTVLVLGLSLATAAESPAPAAAGKVEVPHSGRLPGVDMAEGISQITGTAISPLLGVSSAGAWRYYKTPPEHRRSLPWFCHPAVWGCGFGLLALCFFKDAMGTVAPGILKKPFDMAELFESKASALVASAAFVPFIAAQMASNFESTRVPAAALLPFADPSPVAAFAFDLRLLFIPLGIVAFLVVWMTGHAINVLIALSPFGFIDTLLKIFKMSILGLVVLTYFINPYLGAGFSLLIIFIAALLAPSAFRLTVFGALFAGDTIMPWRAKHRATPTEAHAFIARRVGGVPKRTYGRIARTPEGTISFHFRPWLVFPRQTVELPPGTLALAKGLLYPTLLHASEATSPCTGIIVFPPRYRSHEHTIASHFEITDIRDSPLTKGLKAAKAWLKDTLASGKTRYVNLTNTSRA